MSRIVPAIDTLGQHVHQLAHHPEAYRPHRCPYCNRSGLWCHGEYLRKADREGTEGIYLEPVPIPRFMCSHCRRTCSRLPSCIAPRRWYLWCCQQAALALLLGGMSIRQAAKQCQPVRQTLSRWLQWLKGAFVVHAFHLRSRYPQLGRHTSPASFWLAHFKRRSLAKAMSQLDGDGVVVP